MGLMNGLGNWLRGPYSDDEYDDCRDDEDTGGRQRRSRSREEDWKEDPRDSREVRNASDWQSSPAAPRTAFALTDLGIGRSGGYGGRQQLAVVKAKGFEDAGGIADHLMAGRAVVLNLESADPAQKRRLLDFLSGVVYTGGGQIEQASGAAYIIAPRGVTVTRGIQQRGSLPKQPEGEGFRWAL